MHEYKAKRILISYNTILYKPHRLFCTHTHTHSILCACTVHIIQSDIIVQVIINLLYAYLIKINNYYQLIMRACTIGTFKVALFISFDIRNEFFIQLNSEMKKSNSHNNQTFRINFKARKKNKNIRFMALNASCQFI